jgi:ABC-type uncharacterized transport system YnjBCD ATPase subunit
MNVADNMSYSLRLRRTPREKIAAAVKQAADMLGLQALQERKPRALSGGQRQRVAMGRAIVRTPKAFSSTSRYPISTPGCASRCDSRSASCTASSAQPRFT